MTIKTVYKTVYKKSMGAEYNNLFVYVCWPNLIWAKKLPWSWGEEESTVWELDAPTNLGFKFNEGIEWTFEIRILGFGLIIFRQFGY